MAVNNFSSDQQLVCDAFSLLVAHVWKQDLFAWLLVFNDVGTRVHSATISDELCKTFWINVGNRLWKGKFLSHENWDTNLVSLDHWVGTDHRPATKVDTLTHHLHAEHALFFFKKLANSLLLLVGSLLGHRGIHENVDGILEHDPLLGCVLGFIIASLFFVRLKQSFWKLDIFLDHSCQHGWVGMQVRLITVSGASKTSLTFRSESRWRNYNLV